MGQASTSALPHCKHGPSLSTAGAHCPGRHLLHQGHAGEGAEGLTLGARGRAEHQPGPQPSPAARSGSGSERCWHGEERRGLGPHTTQLPCIVPCCPAPQSISAQAAALPLPRGATTWPAAPALPQGSAPFPCHSPGANSLSAPGTLLSTLLGACCARSSSAQRRCTSPGKRSAHGCRGERGLGAHPPHPRLGRSPPGSNSPGKPSLASCVPGLGALEHVHAAVGKGTRAQLCLVPARSRDSVQALAAMAPLTQGQTGRNLLGCSGAWKNPGLMKPGRDGQALTGARWDEDFCWAQRHPGQRSPGRQSPAQPAPGGNVHRCSREPRGPALHSAPDGLSVQGVLELQPHRDPELSWRSVAGVSPPEPRTADAWVPGPGCLQPWLMFQALGIKN